MTSVQVLRQKAEALKVTVADKAANCNEAWVSRQALQDLYQKLLVLDLEYALDKKVEQDLWNHAFKNQINLLQNQTKDRQNPKRGEIQASLNLFLETASGFYLQLLQELCIAFKLDLPFRRPPSTYGMLKEYGPVYPKIKTPKKTSCMYICQHCLVHLGDIARYRQQIEQAQTYYRHAASLVPSNGQPYNQLAILEAAKGNKLSTIFYYVRSIAVKHPFPVAATNLEKFYAKISKDPLDFRGKLSMSEIIASFLQFHAFVHLCTDLERARKHSDRLIFSLPTHITSMSFSSYQLVQMVAINLFAMHHAHRKLDGDATTDELGAVSVDEQKSFDLVFNFTVSLLDNLLHHTPKQEQKAKEYHTVPALKVLLTWLTSDKKLLSQSAFKNSTIWPNLAKLLNNLQFHAATKDPFDADLYIKTPLSEDVDLQGFFPLLKCVSSLNYSLATSDGLSLDAEVRLRCHRMVELGIYITEQFPSLNLINYQRLKSGRLQFSAPTAHIKVLPDLVSGSDSESSQEKKSYRQNVAIQAIMQKKAGHSQPNTNHAEGGQGGSVDVTPARIQHKPTNQEGSRSDASVMVQNVGELQLSGQDSSSQPPPAAPPQMTQRPISILHPPSPQQPQQPQPPPGQGVMSSPQPQTEPGMLHIQTTKGVSFDSHPLPRMPGYIGGERLPQPAANTNRQPQLQHNQPDQSLYQQQQQQIRQLHPAGPPPAEFMMRFPGPGGQMNMPPPPHQPPAQRAGLLYGSPRDQHSSPSLHGGVPDADIMQSPADYPSPQAFQQAMLQGYGPMGIGRFPRAIPPGLQNQGMLVGGPFEQLANSVNAIGLLDNLIDVPYSPMLNHNGSPNNRSPVSHSPESNKVIGNFSPTFDHQVGHQAPNPIGQSPTSPYLFARSTPSSASSLSNRSSPFQQPIRDSDDNDDDSHYPLLPASDDFAKESSLAFPRGLNMESSPDSVLSAHLPTSSSLALSLSAVNEEVPKPDSPPLSKHSRFGGYGNEMSGGNTYSLFSQSPWTVQFNRPSFKGLPAQRQVKSPYDVGQPQMLPGTNMMPVDGAAPPPNHAHGGTSPWGARPPTREQTSRPMPGPGPVDPAVSNPIIQVPMQSLWSAGPSPLEKLLEQQKLQRQTDPH